MLRHRYGRMDDLLEMTARDFIHFVVIAANEKTKEEIYQQWTALLPLMATKMMKYMTFTEFYDMATGKDVDKRPTEILLEELKETRKLFGGET